MTTTTLTDQNKKATTDKNTFSRETTVSIVIHSEPSIIWELLTNSSDFPRWNGTVISLEGEIIAGGKIKIKSILDEKRVFTLKIKEFVPNEKLVWGDGKGSRVFTILKNDDNHVTVSMTEKIGGFMFPLYAKYIPSFNESFDQFAADLKKEAERLFKAKK